MPKVCVWGGTGFVGLHVCARLVRAGWQVTVPTRRSAQAQALLTLPGLRVVQGSISDPTFVANCLAGQDAVVNLIAILHGTAARFEQVHVAWPQRLAHAMQAQRVRRLVHVSALGADALQPQAAPSLYLRSKSAGEALLLQAARGAAGAASDAGFDLSVLRPSVIFGARDHFTNLFAALQRRVPVLPLAGAEALFQPVWVQDVAQAVVACVLARPGLPPSPRVFELGGPQVMSLRQIVRSCGALAACARPIFALPYGLARLQASAMTWLPGEPLMSPDNLDSMRRPNVCSGTCPGLTELGLQAAALPDRAADWLHP